MGCKRPKGPELLWSSARSEPEASEAPDCRLLAGRQPAGLASEARAPLKACPKGRGVAMAVAVAWLAGAAAPVAAREASDPAATPGAVESGVRAADQLLREARFEEALARIEGIRGELDGFGAGDAGRRLRARTEVMAATAYVALDREDAARECFRRALAAEPALDLDPDTTAPKVLRVFRAVRAEPRGAR